MRKSLSVILLVLSILSVIGFVVGYGSMNRALSVMSVLFGVLSFIGHEFCDQVSE
jgi:hypothetical protein